LEESDVVSGEQCGGGGSPGHAPDPKAALEFHLGGFGLKPRHLRGPRGRNPGWGGALGAGGRGGRQADPLHQLAGMESREAFTVSGRQNIQDGKKTAQWAHIQQITTRGDGGRTISGACPITVGKTGKRGTNIGGGGWTGGGGAVNDSIDFRTTRQKWQTKTLNPAGGGNPGGTGKN